MDYLVITLSATLIIVSVLDLYYVHLLKKEIKHLKNDIKAFKVMGNFFRRKEHLDHMIFHTDYGTIELGDPEHKVDKRKLH